MSPAQSLLFANLDETGTSPSELARRLGQSRQATQDLVARLCAQGLLEVVPDPHRRGGRLVRLTGSGRRLVQEAYAILVEMESALGAPVVDRARTVLTELLDLQERADREGRPHT